MKRLLILWLFSSGFFLNMSCVYAADFITASGCSVSNVGYLGDVAIEYERRTGVKVFVRGGGSVVGIEDLRSGKVDFAASCRSKEKGDPEDIEFIQVAWDVLVFIVHKSNPVDNITLDTVRSIYSGGTTNWRDLKGRNETIKVFLSKPRKGLSGLEASLRSMVLGGREPSASPNILSLASTGIVEQMVEDTAGGVATTGYTSGRKRNVRMLKVNGVEPSHQNIINNRYPLRRPLFLLVPKAPKPGVRKFVDYILSREGQKFIDSLGVISLLDIK